MILSIPTSYPSLPHHGPPSSGLATDLESLRRVIMALFKSLLLLAACLSSPKTTHAANLGQWGPTIKFPLVPVAAALLHDTGELLVWSSYSTNTFEIDKSNMTQTVIYNPADSSVSEITITNTGHDMFCPGISMDFQGRVIVTGGDTAPRTSIFNSTTQTWISGPNMNIPRGYQASTTLSDGRIFTIGGSWSGGYGGKNGEVFDPSTTIWSLLPGCPVAPMLTADAQGIFRQDSHAWLFAWTNGYVFQAGPSKAMNWYSTTGNGAQSAAGLRANDTDAMTGTATMYDAVAGKILTLGGSSDYQNSYATANAHIITLGSPNTTTSVTPINPMWYPRAFSNAIVLPDGNVFIVGGQSYAVPFSDANSSMVPEMWYASTSEFVMMATGPTPRNYHSVGLLMPDGTIFSGGGGLCGSNCTTNHFDGQFYSPPYLFLADGVTKATRPVVASISSSAVRVGDSFTVVMESAVSTFAMVRMGTSTHTVNTDQRRVPLTPEVSGLSYTLTLPSSPGVMLPGYWMMFALDSNDVPSLAKNMLITL
jgi:galactose oxidase